MVDYKLQDLIDINQFQLLLERLNKIYPCTSAIIDSEGKILASVGGQGLCSLFHRTNKEAEKVCFKSDQYLSSCLSKANPAIIYQCPHGLIDSALPIIIDGNHVGSFFTGQLFFEKPDLNFFKKQASRYGFEEKSYLDAVRKVPIWTKDKLDTYLSFSNALIDILISIAVRNLKSFELTRKIQESEHRLETFLQTAMEGFCLLNRQGHILQANESYCHMSGYSVQKLLTMCISDIEINENPAEIEAHLREIQDKGKVRFETRHKRKDGSTYDIEVSAQYQQGLFFTFLRDITKRKQVENDVRYKNILLSTQQEASIDGILVVDEKNQVISCNKRFSAMWGVPQKLIDDKDDTPVLEYVSAQVVDTRSFLQKVRYLYEHKELTSEDELSLKDGRVFERYSAPISESGNRYLGRVWYFHDITNRKETERALRESEKRFATIFHTSPTPIGISRVQDGQFIDVNTSFTNLCGYCREKIIGHTSDELQLWQYTNRAQWFNNLWEKKHLQNIEAGLRRKTGEIRNVLASFELIELGGELCILGILIDITEHRKLEQEIIKTQKLENIGTLAGGIAHDFNNLLQAVSGYISLAKLMCDDKQKSLSALDEAEKALHMSVKLTNQLLTFSKGGKPVKKAVDLRPLIENAAKFALSGARTTTRIHIAHDLWPADADEGQINQVIQNIVLNADQAMPEGGQVEITARNFQSPGSGLPQVLKPGNYVQITIRDTGTGIDEKNIAKIFDPYFTTKEKGTGLGLATSYSIIKHHSGMINVDSEVGKGTAFTIYLPAATGIKQEETANVPVAASGRTTGRLLIMDDEPAVLAIAGKLVESLGHTAEFASQGKEAIEKYQEAQRSGRPFHAVILDLTVRGGMGGAETLQKLLALDPTVTAVVSSGYSDDANITDYRAHGFKAFLKKPYTRNELQQALSVLLKK